METVAVVMAVTIGVTLFTIAVTLYVWGRKKGRRG